MPRDFCHGLPESSGSSTLLVTMILLLLSGACLALLMATQTQLLLASGQKREERLLAAAEGGLQLAVARGIAGAAGPYVHVLDAGRPAARFEVEVTAFVPMTVGPCDLCMANLDGALGALGGLRRASHVASASATAPRRRNGLPPPRRSLTAVVDLMPWPVAARERLDLAVIAGQARNLVRAAALGDVGGYDEDAPLTVNRVIDPHAVTRRVVAVGGLGAAGRGLYAFELSPRERPLWRFVDGADDDGNGAADLGLTVSAAAVVPLRMGAGPRNVAIFGGGFDPVLPGGVGAWLYFVDLDSGQLLGKRSLDAPVTAAPAAVDATGDGLVDRIYAGTTAGSLYRVDTSGAVRLVGGRAPAGAWNPRRIFETGGLPIHHPPAVIPAPALGAFALALGAGGGPDPGAMPATAAPGRFHVFVDRGAGPIVSGNALPRLDPQSPLRGVDRLAPTLPRGEQGWSLLLGANEQPASAPLAVGGLLAFHTLRPTGPQGGEIRRYTLQPASGDAARPGPRSRLLERNAPWPSRALGAPIRIDIDHPGSRAAPTLASDEEAILQALRNRMPARCQFDGSRIRLTGPGPTGAPTRLAVLPVCRMDVDWAEGGL